MSMPEMKFIFPPWKIALGYPQFNHQNPEDVARLDPDDESRNNARVCLPATFTTIIAAFIQQPFLFWMLIGTRPL